MDGNLQSGENTEIGTETTVTEAEIDSNFLDGLDFDSEAKTEETTEDAEKTEEQTLDPEGETEKGNDNSTRTDNEEKTAPEVIETTISDSSYKFDLNAIRTVAEALGCNEKDCIAIIQKGMDYDNVLRSREFTLLDEYAEAAGMSRPQFIEHLERQKIDGMIQTELSQLQAKYPDSPAEVLTELATANVNSKQSEDAKKAQETAQIKAQTERENAEKPWIDFFSEYSEFGNDADKVPEEIYADVRKGLSPREAYLKYQLGKLSAENTALKTNINNKAKNTGSVKNEVSEEVTDPFLQGLVL